ncbi:MAG TPA: hypothetical protein PK280_20885 [Planctomycetota bacterium]|nr:hypothetical protein [Planctomycetota bacterium]
MLWLSAGCGGPRRTEAQPARAAALRPAPAPASPAAASAGPLGDLSGPFFWWQEAPSGLAEWGAVEPFAVGWSRPGNRVSIIRPLGCLQDEGPDSVRWDFRALWPVVWAARNGESGRFRIFPVVWWDRRVDRSGGEPVSNTYWAVMPVLWGGADSSRGKHFAVFPVGGLLKGKLGTKWIRFVAFPLWVDYEGQYYHSWNVVWPVFGAWSGPEARGWRVWPLYGVDERDGRYRRVFVLWPFGHHWQTALDAPHPAETWVAFPFWMRYRGDSLAYDSVLWPFFGRRQGLKPGNEFVEWHAPWPLISWTTGRSVHGFKVFPFYGHRVGASGESRQVLWPLYVSGTADEGVKRVSTVTSAFVFRHVREEWLERTVDGRPVRSLPPLPEERQRLAALRQPGAYPEPAGRGVRPALPEETRSEVSTLLWPLFRYSRNEHGERFFTTLEPWWFRNRETFDRVYGPFFTIYRYDSFADGTARHRALFNLYEHVRGPEARRVRFSPVFDYSRVGRSGRDILRLPPGKFDAPVRRDAKRFQVFGGLFGYERRGRAKRVRLLWMPVGRKPAGWDDLPAPNVAPPEPEPRMMPSAPIWDSAAFREVLPGTAGSGKREDAGPESQVPASVPGPRSPEPANRKPEPVTQPEPAK